MSVGVGVGVGITTSSRPRLDAAARPRTVTPPVRIVHLGLGAFHRAHLAWYTSRSSDAADWGIAAFTGRRPDAATMLAEQDGLYTLVERAGGGDSFTVVESIVDAYDGADLGELRRLVAAPTTAIVSITGTEAAYCLTPERVLDTDSAVVRADLAAVRHLTAHAWRGTPPVSLPARLVCALAARRDSGVGGLAVVSCDNLPRNGSATRNSVVGFAHAVDPALAEWIDAAVSFVDSSVDRITPQTTKADIGLVAGMTGFDDASPVVTEPFSSWVMCGDFPAGRPEWETAGATFVDDIDPFERRKLWLLNGAHSLLAYAGLIRGHSAVAGALCDETIATAVECFWREASAHLEEPGLDLAHYRDELLARFANPRIEHRLAQIATDGAAKLRTRVVPVLARELGAGRPGTASARVIAAWIDHLAAAAATGTHADAESRALVEALAATGRSRTRALVAVLDVELAGHPTAVDTVHRELGFFAAKHPAPERTP